MATSVEMCLDHFYPRYSCPICDEGSKTARQRMIEHYWETLQVLPIDDPTPPQPYPRGL